MNIPFVFTGITVPIEQYGYNWGTATPVSTVSTTDDDDDMPSAEEYVSATAFPESAGSNTNDGEPASEFDARHATTAEDSGAKVLEPRECPLLKTPTELPASNVVVATELPSSSGSVNNDGSDSNMDTFDPRGGLRLANTLMYMPQDLGFHLWRWAGKNKVTATALEDLMAILRKIDEVLEAKQLPKGVAALHNKLHLYDIKFQYGQRCSVCENY